MTKLYLPADVAAVALGADRVLRVLMRALQAAHRTRAHCTS